MTTPQAGTHIGLETETVVIFIATVLVAMGIDMWAHRKEEPISLKAAMGWSFFWIAVGLSFGIFLTEHFNSEVASLYYAGYMFEMALSVDNLFVMMSIFAWFSVPEKFCHRVLFWGVFGAIVFRLIFVLIGASLFAMGPAVELVFAFVVALSGLMMLKGKDSEKEEDLSKNFAYRAVRYFIPVYPKFIGHKFFASKAEIESELEKPENKGIILKRTGAYFCTPLFLCLVIIETTDVMFAFDSVPAVIAISREPLVVYSAMMLAVLGLRSMYFVLDAMRKYLVHLEKAVVILLFFIAIKLAGSASLHLFGVGFDIDVYVSLMVIAVLLGLGVIASLIFPKKDKKSDVQNQ